jgi:mannose-6-phosphate isomerase-like protein (cupin superfamily)
MSFESKILLRSEETGGAISAIEISAPAGWEGPPLHHHAFDEAFYVLDGELTFQLGDELVAAGPGAFVFAPGGTVHTLANLGEARARYLLLCTPAGFERRFDPSPTGPFPETTFVGPTISGRPERALTPPGGQINVVVRGEESAGRMGLMVNRTSAGFPGPSLHHHAFDELFYVVEGELTFQVGDERVTRRAGELAFVPGGTHHTFANRTDNDARVVLAVTPSGFERYFARIGADMAGGEPPEWARQPIPDVTTVGPPIT